jgi:hypothetical protein
LHQQAIVHFPGSREPTKPYNDDIALEFKLPMLQRVALLIAATAAAFLSVQAQDARVVTRIVTDTVPAWRTWKSNTGALNYPGAWNMVAPGRGDTAVVFVKPGTHAALELPRVALVVSSTPVTPAANDQASAGSLHVLFTTPPDPSGSFSEEYTVEVDGVMLHCRKDVLAVDGHYYSLIYTAPQKAYEENLFLADAMMKSFSPAAGK